MNRRDLLKSSGGALLLSALAPFSFGFTRPPGDRLFFSADALPRIRANAASPLLRPAYDAWRAEGVGAVAAALDTAEASGDILSDFRLAIEAMTQLAVVHLVEPTAAREAALLDAVDRLVARPVWDYFLDGDAVIGIMRASLATERLLFVREVLGDALRGAREATLLDAIAEKGCLPCYRTLVGMDHPETVVGWEFDANHQQVYDIDMSRWPEILGANNLRAIPTMGLGLGALALRDRDPRAGLWLDTSVSSAKHVLDFLSADGSYFEGLSYVDYAFRTLFTFLEGHARVEGTVDWAHEANFEGVAHFILAMQAGRKTDGDPDIVNFSDASYSVYPCVPAWIARQTGSGVAQHAVEHVSRPGYYLDFLWVEPERASAPPDGLKNARLDLDWVICRSGWAPDDAVLAFRSGGPANHEHADRNSFFYKIHGERLLNDHFGAAYDWRDPKWLLRLTEAHNAVLVDGRGHQYHNGEEGTNESQSEASLIRYEDDGDRVWWCSDATPAYRLVNDDVRRVRRTVLFAKPDVIVLFDQIETADADATAAVRFFPDNRDGAASIETRAGGFTIRRPRATLHGQTVARAGLRVAGDRLDLAPSHGDYPYVEVAAGPARRHEIVTVLVARLAEDARPHVALVQPDAEGWSVSVGGVHARIESVGGGVLGRVPDVTWL